MIKDIQTILTKATPFIMIVSLMFGIIGAWLGFAEIFPVAKQFWSPQGSPQSYAIIGACLAIITMGAKGGKL